MIYIRFGENWKLSEALEEKYNLRTKYSKYRKEFTEVPEEAENRKSFEQ